MVVDILGDKQLWVCYIIIFINKMSCVTVTE